MKEQKYKIFKRRGNCPGNDTEIFETICTKEEIEKTVKAINENPGKFVEPGTIHYYKEVI